MAKPKVQLIDISIKTIIKFFLVILCIAFLYLIKEVLAIIFISILLAAILRPAVDNLASRKIPRSLSMILIFLLVVAFLALLIILLIPPLASQLKHLTANLPSYSQQLQELFSYFDEYTVNLTTDTSFVNALDLIKNNLSNSADSVFGTIMEIFGGVVSFLVVLVITFYLVVEDDAVKRASKVLVPEKYQMFLDDLVKKIEKKIADWLKGQFVLSFIIGLLVYVGLLILGVDYALILGLVAFAGEFIPYLGPILAALPALFVAFVASPILALFVLILFIIIQQAENHILVPKIMQRAVGLNPIVSVIALLIGAKVAGLVGIIIAIPFTTALSVVLSEIYSARDLTAPVKATRKKTRK